MTTTWARINFDEVDDMAARFGMESFGESRFLRDQVGCESIGAALYRIRPGARPGFGHRHAEAEELYVVLEGTGRMRLDDDSVDLRPMDRRARRAARDPRARGGPGRHGRAGLRDARRGRRGDAARVAELGGYAARPSGASRAAAQARA